MWQNILLLDYDIYDGSNSNFSDYLTRGPASDLQIYTLKGETNV